MILPRIGFPYSNRSNQLLGREPPMQTLPMLWVQYAQRTLPSRGSLSLMTIDPVSILVVLFPVKIAVYYFWIWRALARFKHPTQRPGARTGALLLVRLLLGLLLLIPLWAFSSELSVWLGDSQTDKFVSYLLVYGALRW